MKQRALGVGLSFLLQRYPVYESSAAFKRGAIVNSRCPALIEGALPWVKVCSRSIHRPRGRCASPSKRFEMTVPTRPKALTERKQLPDVRTKPVPEGGSQTYDGEALVIGLFASDLSSSASSATASGAGASSGPSSSVAPTYELSERAVRLLGQELARVVNQLAKETELKLKMGSSASTHMLLSGGSDGLRIRRMALYCLGKEEDFNAEVLNKFGAFVSSNIRSGASRPERIGVVATWPSDMQVLPAGLASQRLTESILLAAFTDDRFRSADDEDGMNKSEAAKQNRAVIEVLGADDSGVRRGQAVAGGVMLTRELVNAPPNVATPEFFAETGQNLARDSGGCVTCTVLEKEDCERLGMGAFLGVAQGSELPPKFIHMKYTSPSTTPGKSRKRVCLVGKGITHDTGGYNLKTAGSMIELMKFDCGGAAACFGTMKAIMALKPPDLELYVITACCENMISGKSYHPGDIVTASNGKTIEVLNTDAEGRLTLADALLYAQQNIPSLDALIDIATLTGACIVALGTEYSGMWTAHDDLAARLETAAKQVGERVWRMPLASEYREGLKGKISDLKNITGSRWGGAIVAALFLQEFVKKEIPWAHLDIAGTVWNEKQSMATGVPTRTLVEFVESVGRS